jgi:5-formyltetrahydrofolate cyclo-ligase
LLLEEKRALRTTMMARRQAVPPDERVRLSTAAATRLQALPEVIAASAAGGIVAGYIAIVAKGEIDPAPALVAAHARGARVALPRIGAPTPSPTSTSSQTSSPAQSSATTPRLRFHDVPPGDTAALAPGRFGLREPLPSTSEVAVESIAVMILPGLAFDRQGRRLGYGGGYYDEAAGRLRAQGRGFLIGLAYDFQLVDRCPADGSDVAVDCVVTDREVVRCRGGHP